MLAGKQVPWEHTHRSLHAYTDVCMNNAHPHTRAHTVPGTCQVLPHSGPSHRLLPLPRGHLPRSLPGSLPHLLPQTSLPGLPWSPSSGCWVPPPQPRSFKLMHHFPASTSCRHCPCRRRAAQPGIFLCFPSSTSGTAHSHWLMDTGREGVKRGRLCTAQIFWGMRFKPGSC